MNEPAIEHVANLVAIKKATIQTLENLTSDPDLSKDQLVSMLKELLYKIKIVCGDKGASN